MHLHFDKGRKKR